MDQALVDNAIKNMKQVLEKPYGPYNPNSHELQQHQILVAIAKLLLVLAEEIKDLSSTDLNRVG